MTKINNRTRHGFQDKRQFKYFLTLKKEGLTAKEISTKMGIEEHEEFIQSKIDDHNKFCGNLRQERQDKMDAFYEIEIVDESEKAIKAEAQMMTGSGGFQMRFYWVPKSLVKNHDEVPGWFLSKKAQEIAGKKEQSNGLEIGESGYFQSKFSDCRMGKFQVSV